MDSPYQDQNNEIINLINVLSFVIGYSNLLENRAQSAHNDVQAANDKQSHYLLQEITADLMGRTRFWRNRMLCLPDCWNCWRRKNEQTTPLC